MTTEPPLTLREVVHRMHSILRLPSKATAVPRLLGLLKAGELQAGFEFPGTRVYWIPIPTSYWTAVSSYKFGSLRFVRGDKIRIGTYQVRIGGFADEYTRVVSQEIHEKPPESITAVLNELKHGLSGAQRQYEVAITNEEWTKYLERNQITASALDNRSPAGRREKTSWHHLLPIIAAYLMTLDKRSGESRDYLYIATSVRELASKEGIIDLPAVDTIKDVISKAFAQAEKLSRP
jgi:hypothetical protein